MRPADRAWLTLAAAVGAYDLCCAPGETLSEGVSRYHRRWPWATRLVTVYVVAHLLDVLPQRVDAFHAATHLHR